MASEGKSTGESVDDFVDRRTVEVYDGGQVRLLGWPMALAYERMESFRMESSSWCVAQERIGHDQLYFGLRLE
jgi:hypothetical protein